MADCDRVGGHVGVKAASAVEEDEDPRAEDRCNLSTQSDLLQGEVVADLEEGREGALAHDQRPEVGVAIAEAADDVEDEDAVLHGAAQIAK